MMVKTIIICVLIAVCSAHYHSESEEPPTSREFKERIIGGRDSSDLELKYQAGILNVKNDKNIVFCGAVIVHTEVVLTAAYCVQNVNFVALFVGTTYRPTSPYSSLNIRIEPKDIVVHSGYSLNPNKNDIAVINLPTPLRFDNYIGSIIMASYKWGTNCDNGEAWVSGWGRFDDGGIPLKKHYLNVEPMKADQCQSYYYYWVPKQHLCSSGKKAIGICEGDCGGPYVLESGNGVPYLCGLNAFIQNRDCSNDLPIYTSVAYYLDNGWICNASNKKLGCDYDDVETDHQVPITDDDYYYEYDYSTSY